MYSVKDLRFFTVGVAPFGNPRVKDYFHLTAAYRRYSRPSSALSAKAFTLRSFSLEQPFCLFSFKQVLSFFAWASQIIVLGCKLKDLLVLIHWFVRLKYFYLMLTKLFRFLNLPYLYGKTFWLVSFFNLYYPNNKFFSIYNYLFRFFSLFGFQWTYSLTPSCNPVSIC